jgi:hypothetical protein
MSLSMHSNGSHEPLIMPMCGMLSWPYGPPCTDGSVILPASFTVQAVACTISSRRQRPT